MSIERIIISIIRDHDNVDTLEEARLRHQPPGVDLEVGVAHR